MAQFEKISPVAMRTMSALVTVVTDEGKPGLGTGVLVQLGGVEFVFTAAHIPWNSDKGQLNAIAFSQGVDNLFLLTRPGDRTVGNVLLAPVGDLGDPDPDVAVLELGPDPKILRSRRPFLEHEIGYFDGDGPPRRLLLTGFPEGSTVVRSDLPDLGTRTHPMDFNVCTFEAMTLPGHRAKGFEPKAGRGVHVFLEFEGTTITHPRGVSGGPLVVPDGDGTLVGLARSKQTFDVGHDQWCEPVVEAVRLLLNHSNADVAAAAARVVARIDALSSRSRQADVAAAVPASTGEVAVSQSGGASPPMQVLEFMTS